MNKRILFSAVLAMTFTFALSGAPRIKLWASQGVYFDPEEEAVLTASSKGIFPVQLKVSVESNDKTLYVKVYRSESGSGPFNLIIDSMQPNSEWFYLYDSEPMEVGKKYYYTAVLGKKDLKSASPDDKSDTVTGWGALTHEMFYVYFNTVISKSYSKMTLMNKPKAMSKLGTEETKGDKSGTFYYNAKVKGIGGVATMSYKNYSDDNIVWFTGDMITNADMFSSGTMQGIVTMSGMYNGTVDFSEIIIKEGKAAGGFYIITPKGTTTKKISYTWNYETLKD